MPSLVRVQPGPPRLLEATCNIIGSRFPSSLFTLFNPLSYLNEKEIPAEKSPKSVMNFVSYDFTEHVILLWCGKALIDNRIIVSFLFLAGLHVVQHLEQGIAINDR